MTGVFSGKTFCQQVDLPIKLALEVIRYTVVYIFMMGLQGYTT